MALLVLFFLAAYFAGVFGLVWFDLYVLDLGDPKFKTSVEIYFPFCSALFSPVVIAALAFLWRSRRMERRLWQTAGLYLALILIALEAAFALDAGWAFILMEFAMAFFVFWKIQQITERGRNAQSCPAVNLHEG